MTRGSCSRQRGDRLEPAIRAGVCFVQGGSMAVNDNPERFVSVLGEATIALWSELPQEIQQQLFERAVQLGHKSERDESLREQLAQFLHDHHERTAAR